jgi:sugar lactone lactonase YvrE
MLNFRIHKHIYLLILVFFWQMVPAGASISKMKIYNDKKELEDGKCEQIAIKHPGTLTLSPRIHSYFESGEPYLWSWTQDSKGNTYVGTGNDGKIFKITPQKQNAVFFDAEELEIYALATDARDNIYAATSPEGKIYKITPTGQATVFFDPPDKYLWELIFDRAGNLYAATGDSCRIYKINPSGKATKFFTSQEAHIEALAFSKSGALLAGSVDNGYLFQIEADGRNRVLLDTEYREIHSIAVANDGTIYLGAYGKKSAPPAPSIKIKSQPPEKEKNTEENEAIEPMQLEEIQIVAEVPQLEKMGLQEKSTVFKLTPEGAREIIWNLNEAVYSIILDANGSLLVGTGGDNGKLYRLSQDLEETLLLDVSDAQISALYRGPRGNVFLCTSNMGKIFEITNTFEVRGTYESPILDTQTLSDFGMLYWTADLPEAAGIQLFTRSGNTADVNHTWNGWDGPYTKSVGEILKSPPARFLQWKAILETKADGKTPELDRVTVSYRQHNLPPVVRNLIVNDPEEKLDDPEQLSDELYQEKSETPPNQKSNGSFIDPRKLKNQALRTVRWSASDPNRDFLEFDLDYRNVGDSDWKRLVHDLSQNYFYRWSSEIWPDGFYEIRVTASDAATNPPQLARIFEKVSLPFKVDNTGPTVSNFVAKPAESAGTNLFFEIADPFSELYLAELIIDSGDWVILEPADKIADSKIEKFIFKTDQLKPGQHSVVIRAFDRFLNIGYGKFQFIIK